MLVMTGFRPTPHNFGLSWGMRSFRIGRSQYGTWWVSVRLPFGFRITRRLGRFKDPNPIATSADVIGDVVVPTVGPSTTVPSSEPIVVSRNKEILERMKDKLP
jgi:hypothetical protein